MLQSADLRILSLVFVVVLTGCTDEEFSPVGSRQEASSLRNPDEDVPTYSQERPGTFVDAPDSTLWKHIQHSDRIAVVGLRVPGRNRGVYRGRLLMDRAQWAEAKHAVVSLPGVDLVWADTLLPTVKVRFRDIEALKRARSLPMTDYVEPIRAAGDVSSFAEGSLGCNSVGEWSETRRHTSLGDVFSIKHTAMGIEDAWRRTGGSGVTVGVIDTGVHDGQLQLLPSSLGGNFAAGASGGRWIKFRDAWSGASDVSPYDSCGHGTEAIAVVAAPHDGAGPIGVAWKSNLVAVRIANGVVNVNSDDAQRGIRAAVQAMDSTQGGKIISMSWQSLNWWWQVSNEIEYWQNRHPNDLLFFGAAGTSEEDWVECSLGSGGGFLIGAAFSFWNPYVGAFLFGAGAIGGCIVPRNSNIVFPAEHPNVVAVTCIDYGSGDVSHNCHYGPKVEFSAYQSFPTVHGGSPTVDRLGGSSGATPVVAGQAALIWSMYPHLNRSQVLDRMRWAANSYRSDRQGYGIVNAHKAVGGMYGANLSGCTNTDCKFYYKLAECTNEVFSLSPIGGDGPYTYTAPWIAQGAYATRTVRLCPQAGATARYSVSGTVKDFSDGTTQYVAINIEVTSSNPDEACPTCPK